MRKFILIASCFVLASLLSACSGFLSATHTVAFDSEQQHDEVLKLHDLQIFENLARAINGQPILISKYSQVTQKLLTKLVPSVSYARNITDNSYISKSTVTTVDPLTSSTPVSVLTTAGSAGSALQTVAKPLAYGFTGSRLHTVNFQQDPVYDTPAAYNAYVKFIKLRKYSKNGRPLMPVESAGKPPKDGFCFPLKGPRRWADDGRYYWVPTEYQDDFFDLTMTLATASPPQTAKASPGAAAPK